MRPSPARSRSSTSAPAADDATPVPLPAGQWPRRCRGRGRSVTRRRRAPVCSWRRAPPPARADAPPGMRPDGKLTSPPSASAPQTAVPKVDKIVVAIHGIGSQRRGDSIRAVAQRFGAFCDPPLPVMPLGYFHVGRGTEVHVSRLETEPNHPAARIGFAEVFWADIPRGVGSAITWPGARAAPMPDLRRPPTQWRYPPSGSGSPATRGR